MKVVYFSASKQTERFVKKLKATSTYRIEEEQDYPTMDQDFLLIVPTYQAEMTDCIWEFMETGQNASRCVGVCGGGNRNFGSLFCYTAEDLCEDFHLPLIHKFEFQGSPSDVEKVKEFISHV